MSFDFYELFLFIYKDVNDDGVKFRIWVPNNGLIAALIIIVGTGKTSPMKILLDYLCAVPRFERHTKLPFYFDRSNVQCWKTANCEYHHGK